MIRVMIKNIFKYISDNNRLLIRLDDIAENMNWDSTPPTLPDSNGYYEIPTPGKTKFI